MPCAALNLQTSQWTGGQHRTHWVFIIREVTNVGSKARMVPCIDYFDMKSS